MSNVKEFDSFEEFLSSVEEGDFVTCTYAEGRWFKKGVSYEVLEVGGDYVEIQDAGGEGSSWCIDKYFWNNEYRFGKAVIQSSTKEKRVALAKKYREALDMYNQAASSYQEAQDVLCNAQNELEQYGMSVEEQEDNSVVIKYNPPTEMY